MYSYEYPRPMVTVDILLFKETGNELFVLLIKRKFEPFKNQWAIPGGFIEMDEKLIDAAKRELKEETNITCNKLFQMHTFGNPGRDPRGRTITILFGGVVYKELDYKAGDDAKEASWFNVKNLPSMAFDHEILINFATDYFYQFKKQTLIKNNQQET